MPLTSSLNIKERFIMMDTLGKDFLLVLSITCVLFLPSILQADNHESHRLIYVIETKGNQFEYLESIKTPRDYLKEAAPELEMTVLKTPDALAETSKVIIIFKSDSKDYIAKSFKDLDSDPEWKKLIEQIEKTGRKITFRDFYEIHSD
jgi:hypothetical protein